MGPTGTFCALAGSAGVCGGGVVIPEEYKVPVSSVLCELVGFAVVLFLAKKLPDILFYDYSQACHNKQICRSVKTLAR